MNSLNVAPSPERVQERVRKVAKLSSFPDIAHRVIELVENPNTSAAELQQIISADQVLSARILKLANSPYYGFPRRINTLNLAIVVLGFTALRDLVLSIAVLDQFKLDDDSLIDLEQFWRHAFMVGRGAKVLAKMVGYPVAGEVFIAGLIHDIGYLVFLEEFPEEFKEVYLHAREKGICFYEAEQHLLEFDHFQLGAWLSEAWNLPDKICATIQFHNFPSKKPLYQDLINIVHLADLISFLIGEGNPIELRDNVIPEDAENKFKEYFPGNGNSLDYFLEKFQEESRRVDSFLNLTLRRG